MIQTYFDRLKRLLDLYATASFVLDVQISFELRPGDQGFVAGLVLFQDRSVLQFREYLDSSASQVTKLMYSYHYRDVADRLVFRYDNANHRPPVPEREHNHTADDILASPAPVLEDVLTEIVVAQGWV